MSLVRGTDFVCIFTDNIAGAEKFPGEALEAPVRKRWGQMPGAHRAITWPA